MIGSPKTPCVAKNRALRLAPNKGFIVRALRWRAIGVQSALLVSSILNSAASSGGRTTATAQLQFTSSDAQLVHAFDWARKQALAYAFSGESGGLVV